MAVARKKNPFIVSYLLPAILMCFLLIQLAGLSILPDYFRTFSGSSFLLFLQLLLVVLVGLLIYYMARRILNDQKLWGATQSELNESREQYRALVETSADGTLMVMGE